MLLIRFLVLEEDRPKRGGEKKWKKKKGGKSIFVKRGEPKFPPSSGRRCCWFFPKLAGKRGGEKRVKIP